MPGYGCRGGYRRSSISIYPLIDLAIMVGMLYILISLFVMAATYIIALIALFLIREFLVRRNFTRRAVWR